MRTRRQMLVAMALFPLAASALADEPSQAREPLHFAALAGQAMIPMRQGPVSRQPRRPGETPPGQEKEI